MSTPWTERRRDPEFVLKVKQHRATLLATQRLELAMKRNAWTQARLAKGLGRTSAWISKLLHGGRNVTVFTLVEVADALGLDVEVSFPPRSEQHVAVLRQWTDVMQSEPTASTPSNTPMPVQWSITDGPAQLQ